MKRNVVVIAMAAILGALVAGIVIFTLMRDRNGRADTVVSTEEMRRMAVPVTVLTYNTHLFGGSSAVHALKIAGQKDPIEFDDDKRGELIAQKLEASGADIVALQELWACDRPKVFADKLKKVYPYSYYYTGGCTPVTYDTLYSEVFKAGAGELVSTCLRGTSTKLKDLAPALPCIADGIKQGEKLKNRPEIQAAGRDVIRKKYRVMNGLLLLSKYPIEMPVFHEFPAGRSQGGNDDLAGKGVITATIRLPNGLPFRLGVTHANTNVGGSSKSGEGIDDPAYWADIGDLAYWTVMGARTGPAIMMGDLNVHDPDSNAGKYAAARYNRMADVFAGAGALDADRQVNKRNNTTINGPGNPLLRRFLPDSKDDRACVDYVFYRPDGPGLTIKPETAKAITDWKYSAQMDGKTVEMDLSDHYPLLVTFSVFTGPKAVI